MVISLSGQDARRMRRSSQLLGGSDLSPADVVRRAVALQGQDLPAVLRAIAVRSRPGTTVQDVRDAFDRGELVRGWPMRGTLFATTPEHLAALLSFTAERIRNMAARRRAELGLEETVLARGRDTLREALGERPLRRSEALELWEAAGIDTSDGRGYHLLMHLCVEGLAHWGRFSGTEQLLTLTAPRAVSPGAADGDLTALVRGFVLARGPVTEADLAWWTKLPRTVVRKAAAGVADLVQVEVDGRPAWIIGKPEIPERSGVSLVPAFDEWILGYADRSLVASPAMLAAIVPGGNGVFRPAVLDDGVAVGTWRLPRTSRATPEPVIDLVERVSAAKRRAIERAVADWPHG
ncbi:winged helix DNA-binding domain-containing protein [Arthrobacter sp. zg-Y859]|uniref:Winged helix DNA-binding domain-containing protein n=1 Tax=Arthrobacter jinronghuae TaxID=2964609 RepID=A0ABT1NLL5_9MICC|nr:winged helix DNA-binding domain-containing protein [Arthrobacter jinronghuae]MCQ1948467.1 winged helix DNA-binding domain-containing protein [Arthrobacter jinronghuae]UWX78707.1 winged helix DNA-binding domain-containing protein [Arthrobacter jinronghuae]